MYSEGEDIPTDLYVSRQNSKSEANKANADMIEESKQLFS